MTISDRLDESQPIEEQEVVPRTEYDGSEGFIQTGPMVSEPDDYNKILAEFGYDPKKVQIFGHPKISKWQQRTRIRGTSSYDTTWLTAYKFTIMARGFEVDLPALYNEVRKSKFKPANKLIGEATTVVCWADIQTGKVDHLGGLEELLLRLEDKRVALKTYLDNHPCNKIIVADVGDIIEGFSNYEGQFRNNALSLMDQVDVAATELWKTLRMCAEYSHVDVLSIPSNHCAWRKGGKSLAGKPTDDWGLHINKRLERHAAEIELDASFYRPDGFDEILQFETQGITIALAHGHQVNNPDQIKNWWAKMTHSGVLSADILITGHFHFPSLRPSGRDNKTGRSRWHIQCPTLDNGSAWWKFKQGEDGDPALAVFQINKDGFDISSFSLL